MHAINEHVGMGDRGIVVDQRAKRVIRPRSPWSPSVFAFLEHLHTFGLTQVPAPIELIDDREIVSFVEGDTANYPLTGAVASEAALMSAARLLRRIHDYSVGFLDLHDVARMPWMLPPRPPYQVICHADFAPYNVALNGDEVVGVFDFDAAHPGPRIWDLAYAVYCWAPFKTDPADRYGSLDDQIGRARLFLDAYGATESIRIALVDVMKERIKFLVDTMHRLAEEGEHKFQFDLANGHHLSYLADIQMLNRNRERFTAGLILLRCPRLRRI